MKFLIINGSAHRGNTWQLAEAAKRDLLMIPYNLFRGMSLAYVPGTDFPTRDGVYWTEEPRCRLTYAPGVPVPWYKRAFGQLFYGIGLMAGKMRFMTVTYKKENRYD